MMMIILQALLLSLNNRLVIVVSLVDLLYLFLLNVAALVLVVFLSRLLSPDQKSWYTAA
jgi:hypothetical protein